MKLQSLFPHTAPLNIVDGSGNQTGITFEMVGADSKQYREAAKKAARLVLGKDKEMSSDYDLIEKSTAALYAACILGWSGLDDDDGSALPYSQAKALEFMVTPELSFIREQVEGFVFKRSEFFRPSTPAAV